MSPLEPPVVLRLDDVKGRSLPGWSGGSGAGGVPVSNFNQAAAHLQGKAGSPPAGSRGRGGTVRAGRASVRARVMYVLSPETLAPPGQACVWFALCWNPQRLERALDTKHSRCSINT